MMPKTVQIKLHTTNISTTEFDTTRYTDIDYYKLERL